LSAGVTAGATLVPAAASITKAILWNTVTETSAQLFTMLGTYEGLCKLAPELHLLLERLDLEAKLNATHALLRGIGAEEEPLVSTDLGESGMQCSFVLVNGQSALGVCMANVNDAVEKIHQDLKHIHNAVLEHQRKWFRGWRGVDYGLHLTRLETHKIVFDSRLETLMKFLMLPRDIVTKTETAPSSARTASAKTTPLYAALTGGKAAAEARASGITNLSPPTFVYPQNSPSST